MAKYRYKIREITAFKIIDIEHTHADHVPGRPCKVMVNDKDAVGVENCSVGWIECDAAMNARMYPQIGDYVVVQPDGYTYLNPKKVFEEKFEKVEE